MTPGSRSALPRRTARSEAPGCRASSGLRMTPEAMSCASPAIIPRKETPGPSTRITPSSTTSAAAIRGLVRRASHRCSGANKTYSTGAPEQPGNERPQGPDQPQFPERRSGAQPGRACCPETPSRKSRDTGYPPPAGLGGLAVLDRAPAGMYLRRSDSTLRRTRGLDHPATQPSLPHQHRGPGRGADPAVSALA